MQTTTYGGEPQTTNFFPNILASIKNRFWLSHSPVFVLKSAVAAAAVGALVVLRYTNFVSVYSFAATKQNRGNN
jgi:hypothetical protein